ncbi:MAG: T9SS type A sorting domain-containing protein [Bacteroidales bacterium]|nr:T9SS type A sorting domain-containing protein [Bacteroidales bacterium]
MKRILSLLAILLLVSFSINAQIYDPEGLNMPGSWDGWANPPTNLAFASATQSGGDVNLISNLGQTHYQTIFSTPTDVSAGTYTFKFTSGSANPWANQWAGNSSIEINNIENLTWANQEPYPGDNTITLGDNKYYVMNWENIGYADTRAIFMELNTAPVSLTDVSQNLTIPDPFEDVVVTVTTDNNPSEYVYVRYSNDGWATSSIVACNFTGTTGTATIPGQAEGADVEFYVFTTSISNPTSDYDLITITHNNNSGSNYSFTVSAPLSCDDASGVLTSIPIFPIHDGNVVITFDATRGNGDLMNYDGDIYAHTGVITSESNGNNDWLYVVSEWGVNSSDFLFTRNLPDSNSWSLTIDNIRDFYGVPDGEDIYKIAMVIRSDEPIDPLEPNNFYVARNADGTDFQLEVYDQGLNVKIVGNLDKDPLVPVNTEIPVCVYGLDATSIDLEIDGTNVATTTDLDMMYALYTGDYAPGMHEIIAIATDGSTYAYDTTRFYIRGDVVIQDLPAGVKNGINYINDNTVTLVLHDPSIDKDYAFVIGDFNNWTATDQGYMKRTPDGTHYWATITGLTPGVEYAYQYYIDGELKLADAYCDKILDPWNDRWIPETTYPNLKTYPWDLTLGTVSVLETGQQEYDWVIDDFTPVAVGATQSNLVIYELLIRDFVQSKDIKDVIDSLDYLQALGVTAIELMPISEFEGNDSWGYAPNFYFAPDKAYGTKNDYKLFIDECHQRGIAVILDVVYNHMYGGSPLVHMYWDSDNNMVASNSAWFNQIATHPYSIGYDFNHESTHTRELVKRNLEYWITEYKIDGFRFDLSKGFTQTFSGDDVGAWSAYDQSRIDIISDYKNFVYSINPNAYFILEHFADNSEEVVLANSGCLLWGVMTTQFSQAAMGWSTNSDFSWANYQDRGFTYPNLIPFMESHDEERIMFNAVAYGNGFAGDTLASLQRAQAAAVMYMTIPGPKMIWQFGELGYDESIFLCWDGSFSDDCRTSSKPIHWEYIQDYYRQKTFWTYAGIINLKTQNQAFLTGSYGQDLFMLGKRMWVSDASMNVSVSANFDVIGFDMAPSFQHAGTWYNYFTGETIDVSDPSGHTLYYNPGDFYVFTDVQLDKPYVTVTFDVSSPQVSDIENAQVNIHGYATYLTDMFGGAYFLYGSNRNIEYTVTADGYYPASGTVNIAGDDLTEYVVLNPVNAIDAVVNSNISIYPNPASNYISVLANDLYKITVYDITGKKLLSIDMNSANQNIDLSNFNKGIYTFIFENNSNIEVKKVIVE